MSAALGPRQKGIHEQTGRLVVHGGMDDIVLPVNAFNFYQKLHPVNPTAELVIFPNDNHNSWDSAYSNPALYEWMLSKKKK